MVPVKNKNLRMYLIILVLSNVLTSTMTAAFRISKNTRTGDVTQKTTSTSVFPVTASVSATQGIESDKTTASADNGKTASTKRYKSVSENLSDLKTFMDTVKKHRTTTESTTVSVVQDKLPEKTPQMSGKANGEVSASPTLSPTEVLFSKTMRAEKSFTLTAPTYKPISLVEQSIHAKQLNASAVIGRKMLSIRTKYSNCLSSSNHSSSQNCTGRTTGFVTQTTRLPPSSKGFGTSTHSTNGIAVSNIPKIDGTVFGSFLHTSINVPKSTAANAHNPSNHVFHNLYKPISSNQNTISETASTSNSQLQWKASSINNNSFGHPQQTTDTKNWDLGFHYDPLTTVPGRNHKDKNTRTIDTKNSNNLNTLLSLASAVIVPLTAPSKEKYSTTTSKSIHSDIGFINNKITAITAAKNTISPNKLTSETVTLGTETVHTSKSTTPRTPITTPYTTIVSKRQTQTTTEEMHPAEVNNRGTHKPENSSSPHFSNILVLLGATATPSIGNGGSSAHNDNIQVYGYKKTTGSEIPAFLPSVQKNERELTFNSTQVESWQQSFINVLRTMFEQYKGNNNVIIVPINIINNSGNVYLMDKNQGSQFSVGERVHNKSQARSLAKGLVDSENVDLTTEGSTLAFTHFSTVTPTYITEISTKLIEVEEVETEEKRITHKKKGDMDEKQGNVDVDSTEFVSRQVPVIHSKRLESSTKAELMEMEKKESLKKKNIKPLHSIGTITVRSSDHLHDSYEMYDSEDSTESHTQANAMIVRKELTKTISPRMKISAKENRLFRADQIDYEHNSAEDTEYPTRTHDEIESYKQNSRDRNHPSVMGEEISNPYIRKIPLRKQRWDYEDVAAPQLSGI